jgi:hypothetical protein
MAHLVGYIVASHVGWRIQARSRWSKIRVSHIETSFKTKEEGRCGMTAPRGISATGDQRLNLSRASTTSPPWTMRLISAA